MDRRSILHTSAAAAAGALAGCALPGTAAIPAVHSDRLVAAEESGRAAVRLITSRITPRQVITPKSVETREERERLSFRVKAQVQVPPQYRALAKPGLPGMAYVKLDAQAAWPPRLACTDLSQPCRP